MRIIFLLSCLFVISLYSFSQTTGIIRGSVTDRNTREQIIGGNIVVDGTTNGVTTDIEGHFRIVLPVGTYNLRASYLGYVTLVKNNIVVSSGNSEEVNFEIEPAVTQLGEANVVFDQGKSAVATDMITPLSVQQLTKEEIRSNPGGFFDVSKVVQTLPGVGSSGGGAQRNDIIIRGGAPNENVYYVDGIEIPVLNHFQTQGSSGGAQGVLNVSFIDDLKLTSSAFDAKYDNALASTFVIRQREGNPEKMAGNVRVSYTESVGTLEGPVGKKTTYMLSARRSYLDNLFKMIDLPIRPTYTDFQYKIRHELNAKTTITALGVGAIDNFKFALTKKATPENEYFIRSLPFINQWNYTTGFTLNHLINKGYYNIALSRNMYNNELDKFEDAKNFDESKRTMKLRSQEEEDKLRIDVNRFVKGWKIYYGLNAQFSEYRADMFNKIQAVVTDTLGNTILPPVEIRFNSSIRFMRYGAFTQVAKNLFNEKLLVSAGIRTDMNDFLTDGMNPLKTLSPRVSWAYHLSPKVDLTASIGKYFKIPTYTSMGFRDTNDVLVNQSMKYIESDHYVLGAQYLPSEALRFTLEGFYKHYSHYPVSVSNGTSLANLGADFGSIGSEAVTSVGKGESIGFEFFVQQKLLKKVFYVLSYTYVRSRFSGLNPRLIPSSWDNQHLISSTLGYKFGRGWSMGAKYRFAGGNPYTPFDLTASQRSYALSGIGLLDFSKINTLRLKAFSQLDLRVDKIINWKKVSFDFFFDIQNALLDQHQSPPYYTFKRKADNSGFETSDGNALKMDGSNAIPVILKNESSNVTPTIGLSFDF